MRVPDVLGFAEFAARYCETQESTPAELHTVLQEKRERFAAEGFMMLRCVMLDSSRLGERVILPWGGESTYAAPPSHPVSPRGLASDISEVEAVMPADALDLPVGTS